MQFEKLTVPMCLYQMRNSTINVSTMMLDSKIFENSKVRRLNLDNQKSEKNVI